MFIMEKMIPKILLSKKLLFKVTIKQNEINHKAVTTNIYCLMLNKWSCSIMLNILMTIIDNNINIIIW